jgi:hypothetical protein
MSVTSTHREPNRWAALALLGVARSRTKATRLVHSNTLHEVVEIVLNERLLKALRRRFPAQLNRET